MSLVLFLMPPLFIKVDEDKLGMIFTSLNNDGALGECFHNTE